MMANQLLLATGPEKLIFIILLYVTANLLLLKEAHPSSSFRYTRATVYIIGCWMFNLLSGSLIILKTKTATQVSILSLLPHTIPFYLGSASSPRGLTTLVWSGSLRWLHGATSTLRPPLLLLAIQASKSSYDPNYRSERCYNDSAYCLSLRVG